MPEATLATLLVAFLVASAWAREPVVPAPAVTRRSSAAEQLAQARRLRGRLSPERKAGSSLEETLQAYEAVRTHWGGTAEALEAMFRCGELYRSLERWAEARRCFEWVARHGAGSTFGYRARLERGHVYRRGGREEAAVHEYTRLWLDATAPVAIRDRAGHWRAELLFRAGDTEGARLTWRQVASAARDPVERVSAYRSLLRVAAHTSAYERAARLVRQCVREHESIARERTERGVRVRRELRRLCIESDAATKKSHVEVNTRGKTSDVIP